MQALRPAPALEDAAGELVDDLDLVVDHRVVDVPFVEGLGLERLDQVVDEVTVVGSVEVVDAEEALGLGDPELGHRHRLVLLVELVVELGDELLLHPRVHPLGRLPRPHLRGQAGELGVQIGGLLGRAGDDQRSTRLVDEDVVDLVDDREGVVRRLALLGLGPAPVLDLLLQRGGHVVAQVVEAELGVGPVGHVGGVRGALLLVGLHVLQDADGDAEQVVDRLHPHRVAAGQIVVDGDQVDAASGQRVQHHRERRGQRLALAGLHLGDRAVVEDHAADQLDVEVAHAHRAAARLAHEREAFVHQVVELLAVAGAFAQLIGCLAQLGVGVELEFLLETVDPADALFIRFELLRLAHAKRAVQEGHGSRLAQQRLHRLGFSRTLIVLGGSAHTVENSDP